MQNFFEQELWQTEPGSLSRARRTLYYNLRILYLVVKGFTGHRCPLLGSALTYTTLLSLVPVLALMFLRPDNQPRSRFTVAKIGSPGQPWEIAYREVQPQTLIRTTGNRDLPARGRFRIDLTSGRVWMSELIAEDPTVHGDFTVEYRFEPALGFLVPEEMRESVWIPPRGRTSAETKGKATYSRFRRFQVTVNEAIAPPKE